MCATAAGRVCSARAACVVPPVAAQRAANDALLEIRVARAAPAAQPPDSHAAEHRDRRGGGRGGDDRLRHDAAGHSIRSIKTVAGRASLEISAPVGTSFDEESSTKIREVPGVMAVAPLMKRSDQVADRQVRAKAEEVSLMALGVDPAIDREVHDYEITDGKPLPTSEDEDTRRVAGGKFRARARGSKLATRSSS